MVKHIILWKLKDEYTAEQKAAIAAEAKRALEALVGTVPGLTELHLYAGALPTSNADMMLDATLTDAEALAAYATHPAHVAAANAKVRPYTAVRTCLDFEA